MKYFLDTEFIEGFKKPLFGKRRHFIDLISIGIVAEDGRTFYAISNEYKYNDADDWVKNNVIIPMYTQEISGDRRNHIDAEHFHKWIPKGKSNKQIAEEIIEFLAPSDSRFDGHMGWYSHEHYFKLNPPEFYGYYADYDWVLFCSLFGRMIDLPNGFPMYCKDLKQYIDDAADRVLLTGVGTHSAGDKWYPENYNEALLWVKDHPLYPKQTNEHNALEDAKWNLELYKFLSKIN